MSRGKLCRGLFSAFSASRPPSSAHTRPYASGACVPPNNWMHLTSGATQGRTPLAGDPGVRRAFGTWHGKVMNPEAIALQAQAAFPAEPLPQAETLFNG